MIIQEIIYNKLKELYNLVEDNNKPITIKMGFNPELILEKNNLN
jgi:hypothetical protein